MADHPSKLRLRRLIPALLVAATACGGATAGGPGAPAALPEASDAEWRALATPRPTPLPDAPRVAVYEVELAGTPSWGTPAGVTPALGLTELVTAGLLRRQDVDFVERRRFAAAAEAERRGEDRPAGAPAAGVSRGPQYLARTSWSRIGSIARMDVLLEETATGAVVARWRMETPAGADAVSLARFAVTGTLAALDSLSARPVWQDPAPGMAPPSFQSAGVPPQAATAFFQGLAAEDDLRWEAARRSYQSALEAGGPSFAEAAAALARTARLRMGGTLGVG